MSDSGSAEPSRGRQLLALARSVLSYDLGLQSEVVPPEEWMYEPGACFVTLRSAGTLRGCIGSLEAYRPLADDLVANCRAAAFRDPRFPPLEPEELGRTTLEISLLSDLEPLVFEDEADLMARLRPRVDGLLLEWEGHRGTFLPAVWDALPEPELFLAKLKAKAGLAEDFWSSGIRLQRYTTTSFSDSDPDL